MTAMDALLRAAGGTAAALLTAAAMGQDFRVSPYLQNPTSDAVTIRWLSDAADPGSLSINGQTFTSSPTLASTLDYQAAEPAGDRSAGLPWLHSVRVTGLPAAANPQIPDYMPGSPQYQWLEGQLQSAQAAGQITFVQYHHSAYSVGPHGYPAGTGTGFDTQSGQPLRVLTPLLALYDVAAVFSGHDEMYEHSIVDGIHFYDVGASGDGLRGPQSDLTNPYQTFLAHADAPEVWAGDVLVSGGKHYGHLEIDVTLAASGMWEVSITPAYAFPLLSPTNPGEILGWERRTYADVVTFSVVPEPRGLLLIAVAGAAATGFWAGLRRPPHHGRLRGGLS